MRKFAIGAVLLFVGFGMIAGCGTKHTTTGKNNPEWVDKGGGAFKDGSGGRIIYGVGLLQNVRNLGLARRTVDAMARRDIATVINTYISSILKSYESSINAGGEATEESQMIEAALKEVTKAQLSGVRIVDHWTDHETKTYAALAKLDMDGFKSILDKSNKLPEKVKAHIRKNANRLFDELAQEK